MNYELKIMEEGIIHLENTASNSRKSDYLVFKTTWLLDHLHLSEEAFALLVYMLAASKRHNRYNLFCFRYVRKPPYIPRTVVPSKIFCQCVSAALNELFDKKVLFRIEKPCAKSDPKNVSKRIYIDAKVAFISNEDWFMTDGYMWIEKSQVEQAIKPLMFETYKEWMKGLHN